MNIADEDDNNNNKSYSARGYVQLALDRCAVPHVFDYTAIRQSIHCCLLFTGKRNLANKISK